MNDKNVVISFSGGLDSTCLVLYYLSNGYAVHAYGFDYGQYHIKELQAAQKNVEYLQSLHFPITYQIINLRDVFSDSNASLVTHQQSPSGHYNDDNMKVTVVENRNVIFSSIIYAKALSLAKKLNKNVIISLGIHSGDHTIYPDTTEESQKAAQYLFRISNWDSDKISYDAPFVNISKAEVLRTGLTAMHQLKFTDIQINNVLGNSISCYNTDDKGRACGKCGTCTERLEAFALNNMKDSITYITDEKNR